MNRREMFRSLLVTPTALLIPTEPVKPKVESLIVNVQIDGREVAKIVLDHLKLEFRHSGYNRNFGAYIEHA